MISTKPYLVRAIREWAIDNQLTPQILVDASIDGVEVPNRFVQDGQIVLNIGGDAIRMQVMDNERLQFSARFNGTPYEVVVPVEAVLAIYAKENGQGIFFKGPETPPEPDPGSEPESARPHLTLVK
ncbi:MAG: ClpXP protease specificity-enhancing factor [Gammaproteobacteria bacterium]|nr:ClpXP protease specificity-enhancing factor [Gammaproteobacteria bacterium]